MSDWRDELSEFFEKSHAADEQEDASELARFMSGTALPAFEEITRELERHGRVATTRSSGTSATLLVQFGGEEEMSYRIQGRMFPNGVLPFAELRFRERKGLKYIRAESMFRSGPPDYTLADVTSQEIIRNFISNYTRRVKPE